MFSVIVVSVLIVLIIHYTIDIFTIVKPHAVDPRVQKYKSIIESQIVTKEQEQELEQYVQTLCSNNNI